MASGPESVSQLQAELRRASECLAAGDPAAMLEALYRSTVLDGLAYRLKRSVPDLDACEITQIVADVIGELYIEARKGTQIRNLGGWIWTLAERRAARLAELQRCHDELDEETEDQEADARSGEEPVPEFVESLKSAVLELPVGRVREAISYVVEAAISGRGWSYEGLSATAGVSAGNARVLVHRGLKRLRTVLEARGLLRGPRHNNTEEAV